MPTRGMAHYKEKLQVALPFLPQWTVFVLAATMDGGNWSGLSHYTARSGACIMHVSWSSLRPLAI